MDQALEILARLGTDNPPSLTELTTARDEIARTLHTLRREGSTDLAALTSVRESYDVAAAAVTEAEQAATAQAEQVDELLDDVPDPDAADETGADGDDGDGGSDDGTGTGTGGDTAPVTAGASTRALSVRDAVARLGLTRVEDRDPAPARTGQTAAAGEARPEISVTIGSTDRGAEAGWHDLAHAFAEARVPGKPKKGQTSERHIAKIATDYGADRTLSGRIAENTRLVDSLLSPTAVAAAGGCCSLATPIYEQEVLSSQARPIRDSLPTVGAQARGAVEFFPAVCMPSDGVTLWTCEDDESVDPNNEATWKPCLDMECEEKQTVNVHGIPVCATVGNFQQRYSPEQWQAKLEALSALQARVAEVALFDQMRAEVTTTHTGVATGSFYVNLLDSVGLAAAAIRQDQRYVDVNLHLWIAGWALSAARADMRARRVDDADTIEATEAAITQALADEGVTVTFSPDVDPIEPDGQTDGPLTPFPDTASAVLAPEGYYSFLDGGELDFGTEIRDHDLNRQNKLSAFAESFEGLLARGCNAKALDIPVEVCEVAAGCGTAA